MRVINKGAILAAGSGNRILELPYTRILPKPMLPLLEKPIIEYVISNMKSMGLRTVYVVVNPNGNLIREYFGDGSDFGIEMKYVVQQEPKGIAHAIGMLKDHVEGPFVVFLGDDLTIATNLASMIETFFRREAWAMQGVVKEVENDTIMRTNCLVVDKDWRITDAVEKPASPPSNWRGVGIYIFNNAAFKYILQTRPGPPRGEKEITVTFKNMAPSGRVFAFPIEGININVNTREDLIRANMLLLARTNSEDFVTVEA